MGAASQVSFGAGVGGLDTCCFRFETEYPRKAELDCSLCILRLKSSTASGTDIGPRHSITSSAMACAPGGMVNPSAFAVRKLMTSSNLVGSSTGK